MTLKRLRGKFDSPYVVDLDSWHGRIYTVWVQNAEFKTPVVGYQERLCHYWRVVAIWAPLDWLLFTRLWRIPLFLFPFLAGLVTAAILAPDWAMLVAVLALAVVIMPMSFMPESISKRWERQVVKILAPFAPVGRWLVRMKILQTLFGGLVLAAITGLVVLAINVPAEFFLGVVAVFALVGLMLLIASGTRRVVRRLRNLGPPPRRSGHVVIDTFSLVAHRVVAAKRGICPIVEFRRRSQ